MCQLKPVLSQILRSETFVSLNFRRSCYCYIVNNFLLTERVDLCVWWDVFGNIFEPFPNQEYFFSLLNLFMFSQIG